MSDEQKAQIIMVEGIVCLCLALGIGFIVGVML